MRRISLETMISKIKKICEMNPYLRVFNDTTLVEYYANGEIQHIWLHTFDSERRHHRAEYAKVYNTDMYELKHYVWNERKGWTYVGTLKSNSIDNYRVKAL